MRPLARRMGRLGTETAFEAAARAGVRALVYASSIGAYAPGPKDRGVDESWPTTGIQSSFYARHKAEVERLLDRFEELFARPPAYLDGHHQRAQHRALVTDAGGDPAGLGNGAAAPVDSGPEVPRYPSFCADWLLAFTKGMVWGIDAGWASPGGVHRSMTTSA
jgi:hypothetical protein